MTDEPEKKGFSGLTSLVSKVDEEVTLTKPVVSQTRTKSENTKRSESVEQKKQTTTNKQQRSTPPRSKNRSTSLPPEQSSGAKWLWVLIVIGVIVIWFNIVDESSSDRQSSTVTNSPTQSSESSEFESKKTTTSQSQNTGIKNTTLTQEVQSLLNQLGYSPGPIDGIYGSKTKAAIEAFERDIGRYAQGKATEKIKRLLKNQLAESARTVPDKNAQTLSNLQFSIPPIGPGNLLSTSQIRWCFREKIRIETKRPYVKTNFDVDAFNDGISDFNQRCGSYSYRKGTLEQAKRDVQKLRSEIVAEALLGQ